jgi:hypothetical protein
MSPYRLRIRSLSSYARKGKKLVQHAGGEYMKAAKAKDSPRMDSHMSRLG